jgi:Domain of unknown function (DUF1905)/Bacteriocin-protection, YdeI or OmpD-Associated
MANIVHSVIRAPFHFCPFVPTHATGHSVILSLGMEKEFSAVIYKQGINPCVDIPERASRVFYRKATIPVRGLLNKHPFRATLVPMGAGRHRLYINGKMRKEIHVDVGDEVKIELEFDPQIRVIPMPEAFKQALQKNPKARSEFERLTSSRRKEILLYMNALKRPESVQRVIERVMESLKAKG